LPRSKIRTPDRNASRWLTPSSNSRNRGLAVLLSEQDIAFAKYVADRAYVIENGHIIWARRVNELDDVDL